VDGPLWKSKQISQEYSVALHPDFLEQSERIVEATIARLAAAPLRDPRMFYTTAQAADFCSISPNRLAQHRAVGTGPAFTGTGKAIRYSRKILIAWLEAGMPA
jgi:hypothetical protein